MASSRTPNGTPSPTVGLVWAQTLDGVIGNANTVPWHVPEDMAHFRDITRGHPVIMGRKTWDSLPPRFRPLPGRDNIVVTRNANWSSDGARVAHSLNAALALSRDTELEGGPEGAISAVAGDTEVWIIGGGSLYAAALPYADVLEVTELDLDIAGDTRAPQVSSDDWRATPGPWQVSTSGVRYRFVRYARA